MKKPLKILLVTTLLPLTLFLGACGTTEHTKDVNATVIEKDYDAPKTKKVKVSTSKHPTKLVAHARTTSRSSSSSSRSSSSSSWGSTKSPTKTTTTNSKTSNSNWGSTKKKTTPNSTSKTTKTQNTSSTTKTSADVAVPVTTTYKTVREPAEYEVVLQYKDLELEVDDKTLYKRVHVGSKVQVELVEVVDDDTKKVIRSFLRYDD